VTVADDCAELATIVFMLDEALLRDNTHTGRGRPIAPLNLYNTDVLQAKIILGAEIPAAAMRCCHLIGEPWPEDGRTWNACLNGIPRWHDRLHVLHLATEHRHLETLAASWVRLTKQALGLRSHPRYLDAACPHCDTGTLVLDSGTEGFIDPRDLTAPPTWVHGAHVFCPACGADWPQSRWDLLLRILEQAARADAST
jgi:hypothetical protein